MPLPEPHPRLVKERVVFTGTMKAADVVAPKQTLLRKYTVAAVSKGTEGDSLLGKAAALGASTKHCMTKSVTLLLCTKQEYACAGSDVQIAKGVNIPIVDPAFLDEVDSTGYSTVSLSLFILALSLPPLSISLSLPPLSLSLSLPSLLCLPSTNTPLFLLLAACRNNCNI
jgi:hypothetical protein